MTEDQRFDDAEHGARSLPLLALLVGCALLGAAALLVPRILPPMPLAQLLIGGALLGFILWVVGFALEIRRGPLFWIAATLVILLLGGALAGFGAFRISNADIAGDASTFAETEIAADGAPQLPGKPDRGPISRRFVEALQAEAQEKRAHADRAAKLGIGALNGPFFLQQSPAVLANCPAIGALSQSVDAAEAKRVERVAAISRAIDDAPLPPDMARGMRMMASPLDGSDAVAPEKAMLASSQALCELLARRSWSDLRGQFAFGGAADRAAFQEITRRRMQAAADATRLQRRAKARFEEGRELVRDALN